MSRRELMAQIRTQSNDTRCFRGPKKSSSRHNKSAKRTSSRLSRRLDKKEIERELNDD